MEKRASEDRVSLNSDCFKRCKNCGAIENDYHFDREPQNGNPQYANLNNNYANLDSQYANLDNNYANTMNQQMTDEMGTNTAMDGNYQWGINLPEYEDMGMTEGYMADGDMGMTDDYMAGGQMGMADDYMAGGDMNVPGNYQDQMNMDTMYYGMSEMNDPYMGMNVNDPYMNMNEYDPYIGMNANAENQMVPVADFRQIEEMFQVIGQMLEEVMNREARIIRFIEELIANQR